MTTVPLPGATCGGGVFSFEVEVVIEERDDKLDSKVVLIYCVGCDVESCGDGSMID